MEHFYRYFLKILRKNREIHAKTRERAQNPLKIIQECSIQVGHLLRRETIQKPLKRCGRTVKEVIKSSNVAESQGKFIISLGRLLEPERLVAILAN